MGLLSWLGSRRSADKPDRLRRWVMPSGGDPEPDDVHRAAAADVAAMEQERRYFRPDAPGSDEDEL